METMRDVERAETTVGPEVGAAQVPGKQTKEGAPLPSSLRQRFEASLGTSLADVRVHTDGDAAGQARDLGARAFTLGRDINFSSGRYQPETRAGQQLLAHEVAHSVQQSMISAGPQCKTEVTQAGDAWEREADAAASAMMRGKPVTLSRVTSGTALLARQGEDVELPEDEVLENTAEAMSKHADEAGEAVKSEKGYQMAGRMDTVNDINAARALVTEIEKQQPAVEEIEGTGLQHSAGAAARNTACMGALEDYIMQSDAQGFAIGQFSGVYQATMEDFARLGAAVTTFEAQNPLPNRGATPSQIAERGGDAGNALIRGTGLTGAEDKKMNKAIGTNKDRGPARDLWEKAQQTMTTLKSESALFSAAQQDVLGQKKIVLGYNMEMSIGARAKTEADDDKKAALNAVKASVASTKAAFRPLSMAIDAVGKIAMARVDAAGGVANDAVKLVNEGNDIVDVKMPTVDSAIDAYNAALVSTAEIATQQSAALNDLKAIAAQAQKAQGATGVLRASAAKAVIIGGRVNTLRRQLDDNMAALGHKLDTETGNKNHAFEQVTKLLAEYTKFVAMARNAKAAGEREKQESNTTKRSRAKVSRGGKLSGGMSWHSVRDQNETEKEAHLTPKKVLVINQVKTGDVIGSDKNEKGEAGGSAVGDQGADKLIEDALKQLDVALQSAERTQARLESYMFAGK